MKAAFLLTALFSLSASADIITCNFTEPFFQTTYSMAQQSLTIESYDTGTQVIKNVSFQIKGPGQFELWAKNGKILQTLTLNFNGSDGMSDRIYPYEGVMADQEQMANYGIGGCTSNFLKATEGKGEG